jgi:hypothetical protein
MNSLIKKEFIHSVLTEHKHRWLKNQTALFISKKIQFRSGRLLSDRKINISDNRVMEGQLRFKHPDYERFLDIKRKRKNGTGYKRGLQIHNRFVYGHYFSIAKDLAWGLTSEVMKNLKKEINQPFK